MKSLISFFVSVFFIQMLCIGTGCAQEKHGEEDGTQYSKEDTYDQVKKGVRLILKYDKTRAGFVGTIENKSSKVVKRARVEVHLSNGTELGPTTPKDVDHGEKIDVFLPAKGQQFKTWSTHAEVGSNEHGHGAEGEREHGNSSKEKGEHSGRKERGGEHR